MNITASDIALVLVGAFYVFAGVVSVRAAAMSRLLDAATAAIECKARPTSTGVRDGLLVFLGVSVLAAGATLAMRLEVAAVLFPAALLLQVVYLAVLAPLWLDRHDPPSAAGRRQSINAAVIFGLATAFVLWAHAAGRLVPTSAVPPMLLGLAAMAIILFTAHTLWQLRS